MLKGKTIKKSIIFTMPLNNKIHLCYINTGDLWQWIKENNLLARDFTLEQEKWTEEIDQKPNFFSDAELLLIYQDTILLKVLNDSQVAFLAKTYQLEYQGICPKLFQENKNIILVSERQWKISEDILSERLKEQKNNEKAVVLFKDSENSEKSLTNWLKEASVWQGEIV